MKTLKYLTMISALFSKYLFTFSGATFTGELFPRRQPSDCQINEYFCINTLTCKPCPIDKFLEPSHDKLACVCNNRSKILKIDSEFPVCSLCRDGKAPTTDRRDCISCSQESTINDTFCYNKTCAVDEILVERNTSGSMLEMKTCVKCSSGTAPMHGICLPCPIPNCACPKNSHELLTKDVCAPRSDLPSSEEQNSYSVDFASQVVQSRYLQANLKSAMYQCVKLKRKQQCNAVANMCVLLLYKDEHPSGPCRAFREYRYIPTSTANVNHLPWLYYGDGDASILLNRKKIETRYCIRANSPDSRLNFSAARYAPNGQFLGLAPITARDLQLCPSSSLDTESAFRFGLRYRQSCRLTPKEVLEKRAEFMDLYLQTWDKHDPLLYAIPLVIRNVPHNNEYPNRKPDASQWLLTRRFFLVDNISGISYSSDKNEIVSDLKPSVVRYLKHAKLWVKVRREREDEGKIYSPFLILEFGELTKDDIAANEAFEVSFSTDYYMDNEINHIIDVTVGILSAAVVVWSGIQTWSYSRRSGRVTIDMSTLLELALTCCGHFSNMLFIVASSVALHTLLFYKAQSVAYVMLPSEDLERSIGRYVIFSFCLKIIEIVKLIYVQMKVDIFLIDWERPRATGVVVTSATTDSLQGTQQQPVSIWRTYFVANEWNEIQTKRKTSLILQLMFTLLILQVYGVENWAQSDPDVHVQHFPYIEEGLLLRFGVTLTVYASVYLVQWSWAVAVYERYIKNGIQEFVDVCSMANVSVFILLQQNYGFYIHGRSAHGFADTDMQTILTQLRREEDDLVGHRGLLPGTEQQTFQIIIPTALRTYYNKVMSPLNMINNKQTGSRFRMKAVNDDDAGRIVEAYNNMNKFLAAFLDHALKDLDYEIREKLFVEQLLDIEFSDSLDRGVFYIDNGHSFDNVLFYGNEGTFFVFDLMLFLCVDMFCHNILYSAIITWLVVQFIIWFRNAGGRKNLAEKTLVDHRFLI